MPEYQVPICGGLGDAILNYLLPGDCGYIADLRTKEPSAKIRCNLLSTNPQSAQFLAPLFDSVNYQAWDGDHRGFVLRTQSKRINRAGLVWQRPQILLTEDERRLAGSLWAFVAVHPFAATENRDWRSRVDLHRLVDALCDSGLTVVMLGGSSKRSDDSGARELQESFEMERPGLVNLVNRGSVRLQAHLSCVAHRFIGSFSCYHCAAFATNTQALVLASETFKGFFSNPHPVYGTMAERDCTQIHYFEDGGLHDRIIRFAKGIQ